MMSKKILILDDDDDILEILSMLLSDHGYDVSTKNSGSTALEDIERFQPDLILMDVMLGDMDGRAICKNIKENHATRSLPVILISGTHDLATLLEVPGAPDDFVAKPFDMGYFLERIEKQLTV
jgi:DNA-binding response OmpR family regulator